MRLRKIWGDPYPELKDFGTLGFEKYCPRCELVLAPINPDRYGKGNLVDWKTRVKCPACSLIIPIDYWRGTWEYEPEK
jgi:hypothetical protein